MIRKLGTPAPLELFKTSPRNPIVVEGYYIPAEAARAGEKCSPAPSEKEYRPPFCRNYYPDSWEGFLYVKKEDILRHPLPWGSKGRLKLVRSVSSGLAQADWEKPNLSAAAPTGAMLPEAVVVSPNPALTASGKTRKGKRAKLDFNWIDEQLQLGKSVSDCFEHYKPATSSESDQFSVSRSTFFQQVKDHRTRITSQSTYSHDWHPGPTSPDI